MNNVVVAQLYRLKYNKTFYVCLLLSIVTTVANFESISSNITIFLSLIVTGIACEDYENGTMKN